MQCSAVVHPPLSRIIAYVYTITVSCSRSERAPGTT